MVTATTLLRALTPPATYWATRRQVPGAVGLRRTAKVCLAESFAVATRFHDVPARLRIVIEVTPAAACVTLPESLSVVPAVTLVEAARRLIVGVTTARALAVPQKSTSAAVRATLTRPRRRTRVIRAGRRRSDRRPQVYGGSAWSQLLIRGSPVSRIATLKAYATCVKRS